MTERQEQIFDRRLLSLRRARICEHIAEHDFLLRRASEDIEMRLGAMMQELPCALNLGAHHGVLSEALRRDERIENVISADACEALVTSCKGVRVVCDEEALPFKSGAIDLVVSALSLHLLNDIPGALIQIRRALKPDGLFLGAVLGGRTLHELRQVLAIAEEEIDGGVSPRVAPFANVRDFGGLLQRAGFALPVTDADVVDVTYASAFELMRELRGMGASNVMTSRRRTPLKREILMRACELYAQQFPAPDGRVTATFEIIHLTGWAPDASQPKPLAPGSAQNRLADALNAQEQTTGEKASPFDKK
jgi:NADH dehydrogenase [ubiquinone] 1 alpha subcomplex assembly factor 5